MPGNPHNHNIKALKAVHNHKYIYKIVKTTLLIVLIFSCVTAIGQISLTPFEKDSIVRPVIFYGYDLTKAKLVDKKRSAKEMKDFTAHINKYLIRKIPCRRFARLTGVDSVIYNFTTIKDLNKQIVDSNIVTEKKHKISENSLQNYVDSYKIEEANGTGCVVIFENFEKASKTTSAFIVVFDIQSKKVLFHEYIKSYDYYISNNLAVWSAGAYLATLKLVKRLSWNKITREKEAEIYSKSYGVDTSYFNPTIFKTSKNELPVTFGINPVLGFSSTFLSGGLHVNADIYHILIGYRKILNPISEFMTDESLNEESYYMGYRFRKNKYSVSLASGFGRTWVHCTSGVGSECENFDEETISSIPIFVEYAYFMNPYVGATFSLNISFADRESTIGLLCGVKFGISRKWSEMRPYNK